MDYAVNALFFNISISFKINDIIYEFFIFWKDSKKQLIFKLYNIIP